MKCTSNSWEVDGRSVCDEAVPHDREIGCACGAESECRRWRIACQVPNWEIQVIRYQECKKPGEYGPGQLGAQCSGWCVGLKDEGQCAVYGPGQLGEIAGAQCSGWCVELKDEGQCARAAIQAPTGNLRYPKVPFRKATCTHNYITFFYPSSSPYFLLPCWHYI